MRRPSLVVAAVLLSLGAPNAPAQEWPKEPIPTRRIRDEVKAHDSGLATPPDRFAGSIPEVARRIQK